MHISQILIGLIFFSSVSYAQTQDAWSLANGIYSQMTTNLNNCEPQHMFKFDHPNAIEFDDETLTFDQTTPAERSALIDQMNTLCANGKMVFSFEILNAEFLSEKVLVTNTKAIANISFEEETITMSGFSTEVYQEVGGNWLMKYGHSTIIE